MQNMYMYVYEKNVSAFCLSPMQKRVDAFVTLQNPFYPTESRLSN